MFFEGYVITRPKWHWHCRCFRLLYWRTGRGRGRAAGRRSRSGLVGVLVGGSGYVFLILKYT